MIFNQDGQCFFDLVGKKAPDDIERDLNLSENEVIFAMKMHIKDDYMQAAQFILCRNFGNSSH